MKHLGYLSAIRKICISQISNRDANIFANRDDNPKASDSSLRLIAVTALATLGFTASPTLAKPIDLQMGARGLGMGGAYTALAHDASAAYWNPAGLASLADLTLSETNWILPEVTGVNVNQVTAAIPTEMGTLSGSWLMQYASLESGSDAAYSEKTWAEHNFSLSGGRKLWDKLLCFENTSVGVTLNRYVLSAENESGAGTGFDLGMQTGLTHGLSLGFMARALGADMMGDKVAPSWRLGLAYTWASEHHAISFALDGATKQDVEYDQAIEGIETNWKAFSGLEYRYLGSNWSAALRGGGNTTFINSRDVGEAAGGFGLSWNGIDLEYAFSYPLGGDLSFGQSHRVTVDFAVMRLFGNPSVDHSHGHAARHENASQGSTSSGNSEEAAAGAYEELPMKP